MAQRSVAVVGSGYMGGGIAQVLALGGARVALADISQEIGIPVIDGVAAATKLVESLVALGLRTGATDEFAAPHPKHYSGLLSGFERPARPEGHTRGAAGGSTASVLPPATRPR